MMKEEGGKEGRKEGGREREREEGRKEGRKDSHFVKTYIFSILTSPFIFYIAWILPSSSYLMLFTDVLLILTTRSSINPEVPPISSSSRALSSTQGFFSCFPLPHMDARIIHFPHTLKAKE
jgi:hypothetical protein